MKSDEKETVFTFQNSLTRKIPVQKMSKTLEQEFSQKKSIDKKRPYKSCLERNTKKNELKHITKIDFFQNPRKKTTKYHDIYIGTCLINNEYYKFKIATQDFESGTTICRSFNLKKEDVIYNLKTEPVSNSVRNRYFKRAFSDPKYDSLLFIKNESEFVTKINEENLDIFAKEFCKKIEKNIVFIPTSLRIY